MKALTVGPLLLHIPLCSFCPSYLACPYTPQAAGMKVNALLGPGLGIAFFFLAGGLSAIGLTSLMLSPIIYDTRRKPRRAYIFAAVVVLFLLFAWYSGVGGLVDVAPDHWETRWP